MRFTNIDFQGILIKVKDEIVLISHAFFTFQKNYAAARGRTEIKMDQQVIGQFIATKRREQNLTQEQLAEKIGVSNKTVSRWETGKTMPEYSIVEPLCEALNVSVSELIAGKESEEKNSLQDDISLLSYKVEQLEKSKNIKADTSKTVHTGVSLGCVIAAVISYTHLHSVGWAILHGMLGWIYVIYYLIAY